MRILQLHCDSVSYEPLRKEIELAESAERKPRHFKEVLLALVSVEARDEEAIAEEAAKQLVDSMLQLKASKLLIYPYAHLSNELAEPFKALSLLKLMEERAAQLGVQVHRAPFGWNKRLELKVKGHPLAEQFRIIAQAKRVQERKLEKEYLILTPSGELLRPEDYEFKPGEEEFKRLVQQEALKESSEGKEPPHIQHFKRFGIEWEGWSDLGHMRYGPEGSLMHHLISEYATQLVNALGLSVYAIKGSNMFNLAEQAIREHAELFRERMYQLVADGKNLVLRYSACFQQFAAVKDWQLSYRHLPFGTFEVADSYRLEQSGELLLGFRLRRMFMPDLHVYCKHLEEAKQWALKLHQKVYEEIRKLGREYSSLYNLTSKQFLDQHFEFFLQMLQVERKPALLCFYPPGINYYWLLNVEYHIIDFTGKAREIATVQIDIGNAQRFGISYVDARGKQNYPVILHSAPLGTVERWMYTLFDTALHSQIPTLPLWLSPVQVRLIPVSEHYVEHAENIAQTMEVHQIRVDVDDRGETVERKVRDAEVSWIPIQVVIGKKELNSNILPVRFRQRGLEHLKLEELIERINSELANYPKAPLPYPRLLSKRPRFKAF